MDWLFFLFIIPSKVRMTMNGDDGGVEIREMRESMKKRAVGAMAVRFEATAQF